MSQAEPRSVYLYMLFRYSGLSGAPPPMKIKLQTGEEKPLPDPPGNSMAHKTPVYKAKQILNTVRLHTHLQKKKKIIQAW